MQFMNIDPHDDVRELVRNFGVKEIRPVLEEYEQKEELPMDLVKKDG